MKSPSQKNTAEETASAHQVKFKFWLGFEVMEKISKEQNTVYTNTKYVSHTQPNTHYNKKILIYKIFNLYPSQNTTLTHKIKNM